MMRVWPAAVARVQGRGRRHAGDRRARRRPSITIEPWDYLYYAEKVRKAKYDLDQDELKPYFELEQHDRGGSFWMAEQLYGLTFTEITGKVPVFHPDVRVWEVKDKATASIVGLFYGDYFARAGKRSGAWALGLPGPRDLHRHGDHRHHLEQQQLRQGAPRRAGADLARRRRDPVPRVRPRACTACSRR